MRILASLLMLCWGLASLVDVRVAQAASQYDKDYFGETIEYRAEYEDTLIHLARNNDLGFVELRAANPTLDPWIPGAGVKIILPKQHILPEAPRKGLVINLAEMRLYYFKDPGQEPITFPISIGRDGLQTPTGSTTIVRKADGPTWRPTDRMRKEDPNLPEAVGPGPDNPLGTHALYLGWPQYLIHGTNKPYGVGRRVSSGCMRMYPEHIVKLWPMVPIGTPVAVVDQPVKVGWIDNNLYLEVSPTQDQSLKIEEDGQLNSYEITKEEIQRINKKAGVNAEDLDWEKIREAVKEHRGYPIKILSKGQKPVGYVKKEENKPEVVVEIKPDEAEENATPEKTAMNEKEKKPTQKKESSVQKNDWSSPNFNN